MSSVSSSPESSAATLDNKEIYVQFRQRVRATLSFLLAPIVLIAVCGMLWLTQSQVFHELKLVVEIIKYFIAADIFFVLSMLVTVWRCPSCNVFLRNNINPRYCNGCGVQLHE